MHILNIIGINDDDRIHVEFCDGTFQGMHIDFQGNSSIFKLLHDASLTINRAILGGKQHRLDITIASDTLLFNSICSAEWSQKSLGILSQIVSQYRLPVINHPDIVKTLSRDVVAKKLSPIPTLIVPKAVRIHPKGIADIAAAITHNVLHYPLLFRPDIEHGGTNLIRLSAPEDLSQLERFPCDGQHGYYLTEFHDYVSQDGNYRKMRFVIVGDRVIPRHLVVAPQWNVGYDSRNQMMSHTPALIEEEKQFIKKLSEQQLQQCLEIKNTLELDYFGIDCHIAPDGRMLLFEATPCILVGPDTSYPYLDAVLPDIRDALLRLISSKGKQLHV